MRPRVLYDADCGFCQRSVRAVRWLHLDVDVESIQSAELDGLGITLDVALTAMPYVGSAGEVVYGHRAWARALQHGVLPLRLLGRLLESRAVEPLAARSYAWIAANRYRLPGGAPQCALRAPGESA